MRTKTYRRARKIPSSAKALLSSTITSVVPETVRRKASSLLASKKFRRRTISITSLASTVFFGVATTLDSFSKITKAIFITVSLVSAFVLNFVAKQLGAEDILEAGWKKDEEERPGDE